MKQQSTQSNNKVALVATLFFIALASLSACSQDAATPQDANTATPAALDQQATNTPTIAAQSSDTEATADRSAKPQKAELILSLDFNAEKTKKQTSFGCDDKVYAVIHLQNYPVETHEITINWLDPYDKQRESTNIPTYAFHADTYTWSALSLHRDVTAGMLQWINPAAGMEEFIGEWKVELLINGKLNKTVNFEVVC